MDGTNEAAEGSRAGFRSAASSQSGQSRGRAIERLRANVGQGFQYDRFDQAGKLQTHALTVGVRPPLALWLPNRPPSVFAPFENYFDPFRILGIDTDDEITEKLISEVAQKTRRSYKHNTESAISAAGKFWHEQHQLRIKRASEMLNPAFVVRAKPQHPYSLD